MRYLRFVLAFFLVALLGLAAQQSLYSQEKRARQRQEVGLKEGLLEIIGPEQRQELAELRREDPVKFRAALRELFQEKRQELEELKETNPKKYERIIKALGAYRQAQAEAPHRLILFETLEESKKQEIIALRNKYKETLEEAIQARAKELKNIRQEDPEEFMQIIKDAKKSVGQRIRAQKRQAPQDLERFKKINPEYLEERLEWLKEEDPLLYQHLIDRSREGFVPKQHRKHRHPGPR